MPGHPDRRRMSVPVSVHQAVPDRTLAVWLDSTPDLSSANSTQAYCVDGEHQPTDLAVGGSNPSRRARSPRSTVWGCLLCLPPDHPWLSGGDQGSLLVIKKRGNHWWVVVYAGRDPSPVAASHGR